MSDLINTFASAFGLEEQEHPWTGHKYEKQIDKWKILFGNLNERERVREKPTVIARCPLLNLCVSLGMFPLTSAKLLMIACKNVLISLLGAVSHHLSPVLLAFKWFCNLL